MRLHTISESVKLAEDLGNLAQLNLGKLADLLKQSHNGIGKRFQDTWHGPGNTSEIINVGPLNKGLAGLRRAYRDATATVTDTHNNRRISAFAVYLNNRAVAFGLFDADRLAGKTRTGLFAYDLTGFEEQIDVAYEKENEGIPSYRRGVKQATHTAYDREDKDYPNGYSKPAVIKIQKFIGRSTSTDDLGKFLTILDQIAEQLDGTITLKLVTNDVAGRARSQTRRNAAVGVKEIREGGKDLMQRLLRYKNSKRPTADTIQRFLDMVMTKEASVVNFGGRPWRTTPHKGYGDDKMTPMELMAGKPFIMEYKSAESENSYETIKISYRYDAANNTIKPWQARYTDSNHVSRVIPMDVEYWIKDSLKVPNLEKTNVLKAMLTRIKDSPGATTFSGMENVMREMRGVGYDWPEFAIIEKSIAAERAKEAEKKQ